MDSEQARELTRWSLRRSFWWSASRQRCAWPSARPSALDRWGGRRRAELADLYVGCALLATRRDLYLDAPWLPSSRGTLEEEFVLFG
ncbi:MAG: hypothetical protein ACJ732_06935 [Rubrobacteraceae bacterium]